MKRIAFFSIPAHGHTNPMLPVARELVSRGNKVRFYSFNEFEKKIKATGAEFVSCDAYLPKLTETEQSALKKSSNTEMTIQDIRIALGMNDFLSEEFETFRPEVVCVDSVCFWGKLNAWKFHHHICFQSAVDTVHEEQPGRNGGYDFRHFEDIQGAENA